MRSIYRFGIIKLRIMKKLKQLIKHKYHFLYKFAKILGISRVALSYKLNGQLDFTLKEIRIIAKEFELTDWAICDIFIRTKEGRK